MNAHNTRTLELADEHAAACTEFVEVREKRRSNDDPGRPFRTRHALIAHLEAGESRPPAPAGRVLSDADFDKWMLTIAPAHKPTDDSVSLRVLRSCWQAALAASAQPAPAQAPEKVAKQWCETCEGSGSVYQEHQRGCWVGGEHACPDCDGRGWWLPKAALAALATQAESVKAPAEPAGWKPIETAPRDGTTVLLAAPGRVTAGEWHLEQWPTASEYHTSTGEYIGQYETGACIPAAWYSWDGGFTDEAPPTHWMPLPAAPTPGKDGAPTGTGPAVSAAYNKPSLE